MGLGFAIINCMVVMAIGAAIIAAEAARHLRYHERWYVKGTFRRHLQYGTHQ